jgi:signal transduction histidine kinase
VNDGAIKILLVEDNPGDVRLLREALAEVGGKFELTVVDQLAPALQRLAAAPFDVLLLDLGLPDSEGLATLAAVRRQALSVPVVVLTGLQDEDAAVRALRDGAQDYLIKGQADGNLLWRALRYAIERCRTETALRAKDEELRAMAQQLWQAAKLATMGELAASIAHELNNPLGIISLRVEQLLAKTSGDDPRLRSLEIIQQELERMSALVANLLQFSRRATPQISSVDVREELERTLELMHYHLRNSRVAVARAYAADVPLIQADRQQLRQLFLNLFTNACDAMPEGGTLTLRVAPAEDRVRIEISDTGVGIAPADLPRIMEPFYTTKPEGRGTGLGLAICRRVVQEHHGTFEIASEGVAGKGATVRLTLPRKNNVNGRFLKQSRKKT